MNGAILSFIIPVMILALIILTRRVVLAMVLGIVIGGILLHWGDLFVLPSYLWHKLASVFYAFESAKFKTNIIYLFLFLLLLGGFSQLLLINGATQSFEIWARQRVGTQKRAELLVFFTGVIVFLNGYFSAIVSGGIAKSLSKYSSPQRMAYIIDSTAVPICVLIPISSWGAYILGLLGQHFPNDVLFVEFSCAIMQSFYAWLAITAVFLAIVWRIDFKAMKKTYHFIFLASVDTPSDINASFWLILSPILTLIGTTLFMIIGLGVYHSHSWNVWKILSSTDMIFSLFCGVLVALLVLIFKDRSRLSVSKIYSALLTGSKGMLPLLLVLICAWAVGAMIKEDLKSGMYLSEFFHSFFASKYWGILPAGLFIISSLVAFSTGSGGGSLAIIIPLGLDLAMQTHISPSLALASVISGAIYGDHASPISDTTIISASSANCSLQSHFITQLPYATLVAFCSLVGFMIEGLSGNTSLAFVGSLALLIGILWIKR